MRWAFMELCFLCFAHLKVEVVEIMGRFGVSRFALCVYLIIL